MQPVDIEYYKLLEKRVSELEKILASYSIQLNENNEILKNILLSVASLQEDYITKE